MISPPRALLLLGLLTAADACPLEPTPTPTPTPTPAPVPTLDFDPSDALIICDERGWHFTLRVEGWTEIQPAPVLALYDPPPMGDSEDEPPFHEVHPISLMDSFAEPYYEVLYLDLEVVRSPADQVPGRTTTFRCPEEPVMTFAFCSEDYFYSSADRACWFWGFAPEDVLEP